MKTITNAEKLNLLDLVGENKANKTEVIQLVKGILEAVKTVKVNLESRIDGVGYSNQSEFQSLTKQMDKLESTFNSFVQADKLSEKKWQSIYNELSYEVEQIKNQEIKDYSSEIRQIYDKIEVLTPVTLRDKLETLDGKDRLQMEAIDGLKEELARIESIKGIRAIGGGLSRGVADRLYAPVGTTGGTVSTGATAPSSTPSAIGEMYVDTVTGNIYISIGTASSADWRLISSI